MKCKFCSTEMPKESGVCPACGRMQQENPINVNDTKDPGKMMGIISLILGICSIIIQIACSCCSYGFSCFIALIMSIVGVILGRSGLKSSKESGFGDNTVAKVGFIINIVSGVLAILTVIALIVFYILYFGGLVGATILPVLPFLLES